MTIIAFLVLLSAPAAAGPCDDLGHAIAVRTKAAIERITPEFGNVEFRHSAANEMTLVCGPGDARSLFVTYEGSPDVRFLALASVAGEILLGGPPVSPKGGEGGAKSSNAGSNGENLSAWNGAERLPRYRGLRQGEDCELARLSRDLCSRSPHAWELVPAPGRRREQ